MEEAKPAPESLRLYGQISDRPSLDWEWVERQLLAAGTYWVVARSSGHPHPRPVWGIWIDNALVVSVGSPALAAGLDDDPRCTVHLDSGTDVVIVEGAAARIVEPNPSHVGAYDRKYEWAYSYDEYGPLTKVTPKRIVAWRSAGWAGRDGFEQVSRFDFA